MRVLSKQDTARLLKWICTQRNTTPQQIVREIQATGVELIQGVMLRHISGEHAGIYYLHHTPVESGNYEIHVDGICVHTESKRAGACAYADKMCQLLFTANEITVVHGAKTLVRWVRVKKYVGRWFQR